MSDDLHPPVTIYIEDNDALEALCELVEQIRNSGYRKHGHRSEMNTAYQEAVSLLTARGLLKLEPQADVRNFSGGWKPDI